MKFFLLTCLVFLLAGSSLNAQLPADTVPAISAADSPTLQKASPYRQLLDSNIFLRGQHDPQAFPVTLKKQESPVYFYVVAALLLFLGIMKVLYSRYFNTLFRVFFNTSLRQNQLTDQLEQAKVPSFLFNIFFVLSGGLYLYLLIRYFNSGAVKDAAPWQWCIPAIAICYLGKYISLRFTGWITNYREEADTYIFIIFLLNKVIGILLLPFIIVLLFGSPPFASYTVMISVIMLLLVLLLRFYRSWSLLQNRLRVTGFHFFLYILSIEILPIVLIYKAVMLFLGKSS